MKYRRVLLKLSGESLQGNQQNTFESTALEYFASEIALAHNLGVQIAIVIGGGNIMRGAQQNSFSRTEADTMGMLATILNSIALKAYLQNLNVPSIIFSSIEIQGICPKIYAPNVIHFLENGFITILAGGTGNPFFTTDTAAVLRALEIQANILLKGTRVDGVYSDDPEKNPNAVMFDNLKFEEAYKKQLKVMDLTAFTLCMEHSLPIIVFNMNIKGNLANIIQGKQIGTLISHF